MSGILGGTSSGGGQFNSGSVANISSTDASSGTTGSNFDQSPSGVVGDPFFDPVFGSQMLSGQNAQTGLTPPATGIGEPASYTAPQTPEGTDQQASSAQGNKPNNPTQQIATGLGQIAKLLGGTQQQQKAPSWIQPKPQVPQAPPIPPQVANANAQGDAPAPQAPPTPSSPVAQPVPLPRRRPDEAPAGPAAAAAAGDGSGKTDDPVTAPAAAVPAPAATPTSLPATPQGATQGATGAGSFPGPSVALLQWLAGLLSGGQANLGQVANQARRVQTTPEPQPQSSGPPQIAPSAAPEAPASGAANPRSPPGAAPDQTANLISPNPRNALQDILEGRTPAPGIPAAPATPGPPLSINPQDYFRSVVAIESGGNPGATTGSNRGLAQFGPEEERMYGINARNRRDPQAQAAALQREYEHHRGVLNRALGRDPEPWESYFTHQQGIGGGPALLTADANAPAWRVLQRFYRNPNTAVRAITGNIPRDNPLRRVPGEQVTAGQFRVMWRERYNRENNRTTTAARAS